MFLIGQSPGGNEDVKGVPWIGIAGKEVREAVDGIYLNWSTDVYRTNAGKCHPAGNRKYRVAEQEACLPWLEAELSLWLPSNGTGLIILVGEDATKALYPDVGKAKGPSFSSMRRRTDLEYLGHPVRCVLHPSALFRRALNRPEWEDSWREIGLTLGTLQQTRPFWTDYVASLRGVLPLLRSASGRLVGLDTEFYRDNTILGASFSWAAGQASYALPGPILTRALDWLVWGSDLLIAIHSAQADVPVIAQACRRPIESWPWERTVDTAVMAYILREEKISLKDLTLKHFGIRTLHFEDVAKTPEEFSKLSLEEQTRYAAADPDFTRRFAVKWIEEYGFTPGGFLPKAAD